MNDGINFHDLIANNWLGKYTLNGFQSRRLAFNLIFKRIVAPGSLWCDLGCGSGALIPDLLSCGAKVIAVDGSPKMLSFAKINPEISDKDKVIWLCKRMEDVSFDDNVKIDGIVSSSVLEYIDNPSHGFENINKILNIGGQLIISIPPKLSIIRLFQKSIRYCAKIFCLNLFSYLSVSKFEVDPKELSFFISKFGFLVTEVVYFDPYLPKFLYGKFRPSLLIIVATKFSNI